MNLLQSYFEDLLSLFYPELCAGCGADLLKAERVICSSCIFHLPMTNFHLDPGNRAVRQLGGRFPFIQASAFLHFRKGGIVQHMMHQLKYKNRPEVGRRLGELYGYQLLQSKKWIVPDLIVPVPLHPARYRQRGYNQAEVFAQGLSTVLNITCSSRYLIKRKNTATQTKRSRFSRYENLQNTFQCRKTEALQGKHILIVDDVLTTGATLEACCNQILKIQGTSVSIGTIAFTD